MNSEITLRPQHIVNFLILDYYWHLYYGNNNVW